MPARKKVEPVLKDLSQLLDYDEPTDGGTPSAPSVDDDPTTEQETEEHENSVPTVEQIEIEQLRAELAAIKAREAEAARETVVSKPKPESELSPEEKQIRALQDELARVKGKNIENVENLFEEGDGVITIHVVKDGLTAQDHVWCVGQEIVFGPQAYEQTKDRYGSSWLSQTEEEQIAERGDVYFRRGPWPGARTYEDPRLKNVSVTVKAPVVQVES